MKPTLLIAAIFLVASCGKNATIKPAAKSVFNFVSVKVDSLSQGFTYYGTSLRPDIQIRFSSEVDSSSIGSQNLFLMAANGSLIPLTQTLQDRDSLMLIQPLQNLEPISKYVLTIDTSLKSTDGTSLLGKLVVKLVTRVDSSDKFSRISDSSLLDLVEHTTFRYFWDFGHPVSGMARERNTSGDICATGGTGFGIMSILVGIRRNFISRSEGLDRIQEIVHFLSHQCSRYHGVFAHWINGSTGATIPFSSKDDGGDLVETSYLMEGLLCARQFFSQADLAEDSLRSQIDTLWNGVDWNWYRQNGQQTLYWHWSPDYGWAMNMQINGWNEAMIAYILAASSNTHPIPKSVYDNGWARNGAIRNGNAFFGIPLPLGSGTGGPLFFTQYTFMCLNPFGLKDAYANYWTQDTAQSKINYLYCVQNPHGYNGYGPDCWGLTASDDDYSGYSAHAPDNDLGVISPTAAISSLPFTPPESMKALHYFYYKLGDKIWGSYGFTDAFDLSNAWFASSYLAIDQGPEIAMIENYRSAFIWNLFMSCPEIQRGLLNLGFN